MTQYVFGTGQMYSRPVGGGAPLKFGALQDVSVDLSADIKELHGQYQFALDTARGKVKVEWKAASGNIDAAAFNAIYFGVALTTGNELVQAFNEAGTIPAMTTYTVTAANGATFDRDLGVRFAATGVPLKQVPSAPTAGQYTVSNLGVYTFHMTDANKAVLIDYLYRSTATGGFLDVSNTLMGDQPRFELVLTQRYAQKSFTMIFYAAVTDKLSLPLKQDDYLIAEMSGSAFANDAGQVLKLSTTSIVGGGN